MASTQRFVNGLRYTYTNYTGRTFCRFLVEWLTRVVGWTMVDKAVGTKWDNVLASGSSTCHTREGGMLVDITSGGYAFSAANVGHFLTLTGFPSPWEQRDGIYQIRRYVGSVGSVYSLWVDIERGVHEDGLPVGYDLNWRLWSSDANCVPVDNDIAVIGAMGYTGASKSVGVGVGDSLTYSGGVVTLVDADAQFVASDVGKSITIAHAQNPANDGTFIIGSRVDANTIQYANVLGVTETHAFDWSISYVWHMWIKCNGAGGSYSYGMPSISISPFGSWNSTTHAWNDSRYTSAFTSRYLAGGDGDVGSIGHDLWGEADKDHFTLLCRSYGNQYGSATRCYYLWHYGELDSFHPEADPRPVIAWHGSDGYDQKFDQEINYPLILLYYDQWYNSCAYGLRGLSWDELTTLGYVATVPATLVGADYNAFNTSRKMLSSYSEQLYRCPIIAECQSSGHMELRGVVRTIFACNNMIPMTRPQGTDKEWFAVHGLMWPWNGSQVLVTNVGFHPFG